LNGQSKAKLLRVEISPEKLEQVKLPTLVVWLDADGRPLRQQVDAPGLGKITLYRTSRELAMAPGLDATITDIGISNLIRLGKKLTQPYDLKSVTYRITIDDEDDPASAFARDDRQQVKQVKGSTVTLEVTASRGPVKGTPGAKIGDEFLQSSYFITAADAKVKELARKAVGKEKDPWKKALLIEKWVHLNMRGTNKEALAPADEVARTLEGDCTEFAMLMAAMCRAEGVPSRTAIGLIYADTKGGPVMAFHMWTEVWVQDQWVPLDATLGRGYVGATHLKITDHSWHETRSLTPLLPLIRVLGKVQIEVVSNQ
jgi:transglutaminase-like putative cysteine protease